MSGFIEDDFTCHQHQVEERGDGGAHDEVTVTAELDEGDEGEENASDDPARVFVLGWGKYQPEDSAFEQKEEKEFIERKGLESAGLGGGVGGEEER